MDKLDAEIKEQQDEGILSKSYCAKAYSNNEKTVYAKNAEEEDPEGMFDRPQSVLKRLIRDIDAATKLIGAFQIVVANQRVTHGISKVALARLEGFYANGKGKAALAQQLAQHTPPALFNQRNYGPVHGLP